MLANPDGVCAVHCKAGKGRTGLLISAYLLFMGACKTPKEAMQFYARRRTFDGKVSNHLTNQNQGLTIPSQKRYLKFFDRFLRENVKPPYLNRMAPFVRDIDKIREIFRSTASIKLLSLCLGPFAQPNVRITLAVSDFSEQDLLTADPSKRQRGRDGRYE